MASDGTSTPNTSGSYSKVQLLEKMTRHVDVASGFTVKALSELRDQKRIKGCGPKPQKAKQVRYRPSALRRKRRRWPRRAPRPRRTSRGA